VEVGPAEVRVLRCLCHLFALSVMEDSMADFRAHDYLDATQATLVSAEVMRLCRSLRLDAVSLVDSWQLSDKLLNSALGREDGKVYEALLRLALRSPLNAQDITPTYHTQLIKLTMPANGSSRL
jgi:acyl-CoA oxidase